jgi:glutaminyl-tRNA synthetase
MAFLDHCLREDLNRRALRMMAVIRPLKLVITNYPEGQTGEMEVDNNPEDPNAGKRKVPFSRELYIERGDFMEDPPRKFFRLGPGREVRLKGAYIIKCEDVMKDADGNITELHCTYDPETKSGMRHADRKVKGTLHWVSAEHAVEAEVRLYDHLFSSEDPDDVPEGKDFTANLNPDSLEVLDTCYLEPALRDAQPGTPYQFLRLGYFCVDSKDSVPDRPVFNRTVTLRDTWAKMQKKG